MKFKPVIYGVFALVSTAAIAQTPQQTELPLNNSRIEFLTGVLIPEHQEAVDAGSSPTTRGPLETVPEACRFSLSLARGEKAKEARAISDIQVNSANGTCEGQFEVGEPSQQELDMAGPSASEAQTAKPEGIGTVDASPNASVNASRVTSAGSAIATLHTALGTVATARVNIRWGHASSVCVAPLGASASWVGSQFFNLVSQHLTTSHSCTEYTGTFKTTFSAGHPPACFFNGVIWDVRTQVHGFQNGLLTGDMTWSLNRCSGVFHPKLQVVRTLN